MTLTLHSLFQSKMAVGVDFLGGYDLEAILDILEADEEMEEEFINEVENVSTNNTRITYYFGERERKMTHKPEHLRACPCKDRPLKFSWEMDCLHFFYRSQATYAMNENGLYFDRFAF